MKLTECFDCHNVSKTSLNLFAYVVATTGSEDRPYLLKESYKSTACLGARRLL